MYITFVHVLFHSFSTRERVSFYFVVIVVFVSRAGFGRHDIVVVVADIAGVDSRFSRSSSSQRLHEYNIYVHTHTATLCVCDLGLLLLKVAKKNINIRRSI